ncbi:NAD(P)-binding protein [Schizopora paradoxa]|uniref:NAD(P)-binding protein n=1 Tax=Schizopora paradoxa TaxID=27342 RepID=A0A0H2S6M6_9AGAM|nr:NAD(P)-binding protein [Schizopora paradoxa]
MSLKELNISNLFNVKGKIAVVSGGGSGIGKMIASALVANGAKVYIAARKEAQLKEAADELNAEGPGSCHYIVADLGSKAGCVALTNEIKKREQKIHILVNNSGASWGANWDDFPEKEGWDRLMALNVKSIFYMTVGLTDLLAKDSTAQDPARIINISSTASVSAHAEGSPLSGSTQGLWSYHTSKAAVNHLTSQLALTLGKKKITVNAILPGIFPSKMTSYGFRITGGDKIAAVHPMGRVGSPTDMAGTALFLCSPASAHVTGSHIILDGGATLSSGRIAPEVKL